MREPNYWLVCTTNLDNIRTAYDRLVWGFPDISTRWGEKYKRNWRYFVKMFNRILSGDVMVFQHIKGRSYLVHAIGVVKDRYYDDETPILSDEVKEGYVIFPWKVRLGLMIFSEEPIAKLAILTQDYLTGYGIGRLRSTDIQAIVTNLEKITGLKVRFT